MTWATERLDELKAGTAVPPAIVKTLGLGLLDDWGEGWVKKSWSPGPELQTSDGSLFGGYLAALADQVLVFATMSVLPEDTAFRTLNLQMNFIRVSGPQTVTIEAKVVSRTKQLVTARAVFRRADGELLAEATAQQLLMSTERAELRRPPAAK